MKKAATSGRSVEQHRVLTALVLVVAAVAFGVTGWFYGVQPLAFAIDHWKLALDYSEVQAKVVTREGKAPDGMAVSWLAARYEVNGKTYFAEGVREDSRARESMYDWIALSCSGVKISPNDGIPKDSNAPPSTISSNCSCTFFGA